MTKKQDPKYINELLSLLVTYDSINDQLSILTERKDDIRNQIADRMHKYKLGSVTVNNPSNNNTWSCGYQERTNKSVNYHLLMEHVGSEIYHEIVKTNTSTSLIIRRTKKKQDKSDLTNKSPVEVTKIDIPFGEIS